MTSLLVDANSLYARAWYACKEDPFETVKAAINTVLSILNPDRLGECVTHTMFCWDGGQKKAKERAERPEAYESTKPKVKDALCDLFGATHVRLQGYEADDVIATAAFASRADHVIIASGDKDMHQLQGGNISYYDLNTKGYTTTREILKKWNVKRTSQVALALAVQGDTVDNIQGIRGWGKKKVKTLFQQVTPDMKFDVALDAIDAQIPEEKKGEFFESLNLTLLNTNVAGVPEPTRLVFADSDDVLWDLGLDEIIPFYRRIVEKY